MNRLHWQGLAEERVRDAVILLDCGQWSAAYYLIGYAVECGLKSCVVAFVEAHPDIVFRERKYSERCWTHDFDALIELAGLKDVYKADAIANPLFGSYWGLLRGWNEGMRYEFKSEEEARRLHLAVTHNVDGILPWLRTRW